MLPRKLTMRDLLCACVLVFQPAAIARSRTMASRYFCWAPFDMQTRYDLTVVVPVKGRLSQQDVCSRYHLSNYGGDNRSPQHVIDIVRQYEDTYGRPDRAEVTMRYMINGVHPGEWKWPAR